MATPEAPRTRILDWKSLVQKAWGKDYNKPEKVYEFSNGRTFEEKKPGGPYDPNHG
jgi:hypothetical protein